MITIKPMKENTPGRRRARLAALLAVLYLLLPRAAAADVRTPLSLYTVPLLPGIIAIETVVFSMVLRPWHRRLGERVFIVTAANVFSSAMSTAFSLYHYNRENLHTLVKAWALSVALEWLVYVAYFTLKRAKVNVMVLFAASLLANAATYIGPIASFAFTPDDIPFLNGQAARELRRIAEQELEFQRAVLIDEDHDGKGEFGFIAELTGQDTDRMSRPYPKPPIYFWNQVPQFRPPWASVWATSNDGIRYNYGYYFLCYLPTGTGYVRERSAPPAFDPRDTKGIGARSANFLVYAWPIEYGESVSRAWAVDASGVVVWTSNRRQRYSGLDRVPAATAALDPAGRLTGASHYDGGDWQPMR